MLVISDSSLRQPIFNWDSALQKITFEDWEQASEFWELLHKPDYKKW